MARGAALFRKHRDDSEHCARLVFFCACGTRNWTLKLQFFVRSLGRSKARFCVERAEKKLQYHALGWHSADCSARPDDI
jgi:hypothetical protein